MRPNREDGVLQRLFTHHEHRDALPGRTLPGGIRHQSLVIANLKHCIQRVETLGNFGRDLKGMFGTVENPVHYGNACRFKGIDVFRVERVGSLTGCDRTGRNRQHAADSHDSSTHFGVWPPDSVVAAWTSRANYLSNETIQRRSWLPASPTIVFRRRAASQSDR